MLRLSVEFPVFNLDTQKLTRSIQRGLRDMYRDAMLEFVVAAEERLPVLTGQVKGVLLGIIRSLGLVYTLDFAPDSPYADEIVTKDGMSRKEYLEARGQNPEAGAEAVEVTLGVEGSDFVLDINVNDFASGGGYYERWEENETQNPDKPGPWQSFAVGEEALKQFFETVDINDYVSVAFDDENIIYVNGYEVIF